MARDFEDVHDLDDLSDDELRGLVSEHLAAHNGLDIDDITIDVKNGAVTLAGRVGTDSERLVAEHVVTDVLGVQSIQNDIFVDPTRRATSPEAVDEHLVNEDRTEGLLLGDRPEPRSDEDEETHQSLDSELYGATDVQTAITDGTAWIPPESPTAWKERSAARTTDRGDVCRRHRRRVRESVAFDACLPFSPAALRSPRHIDTAGLTGPTPEMNRC